jgi:ribonucleoside-diphosphate reductase alpha chain
MLVALLYTGEIPKWDLSKVRPAGAPLKTFGGRSSGPGPLDELFKFVVRIFANAKGRKLTSLECHDIMCKIAEVVVVGGVRRSAMISLSNLSDDRMRNAKSGAWWEANVQRALSNNSAVYTEKPEVGMFLEEWLSLYQSKSGERGIFSREASQKVAKKNGRRDSTQEFGTNPCSEIILRPYQFCNLTEVVVRENDTDETLAKKVRIATILGTFQSTLTHFPYLRKIWQKNTEEERLLGVSLTGIYDSKLLNDYKDAKLPGRLEKLRQVAIDVNKDLADELGIPVSAAITAVKPSGTVSQLVDAASGIHPRHDPYYFRRVRSDIKDPLTKHLITAGIPHEPDVTKPDSTVVFTFPKKAPEGATMRSDVSAIDHLELWLKYQRHWCEHKPSVTISVKEEEWPTVGAWVWEHFDEMSGVSFLPHDGGTYRQAPYETVTEEQYEELLSKMPTNIDWSQLVEREDNVEGVQTLACVAGGCEI